MEHDRGNERRVQFPLIFTAKEVDSSRNSASSRGEGARDQEAPARVWHRRHELRLPCEFYLRRSLVSQSHLGNLSPTLLREFRD